jgi:peptide/nickel transport system permease protein
MWKYIVKRFLLMIPTLLGVALLTFVPLRIVPGDVVEARFVAGGVCILVERVVL